MSETGSWIPVCALDELLPGAGVCALVDGRALALFYLPEEEPALYAIDNHDPVGGAGVLSRGIVGDIGGELVVASPLYKQHFSLRDGRCLEREARVAVWDARLEGGRAWVRVRSGPPG